MFCRLCGRFQKKSVLCWCWEDLQLSHAWEPVVIITQWTRSQNCGEVEVFIPFVCEGPFVLAILKFSF